MANPQKENGYTAIANEILEKLLQFRIDGREFRILLAIIRKTYGFHKKKDRIPLSQLADMTKISRHHICKIVKDLEAKKLIIVDREGMITVYSLNKDYEKWVKSAKEGSPKQGSPTQGTGVVPQKGTEAVPSTGLVLVPSTGLSKESIKDTKETIQKKTSEAVASQDINEFLDKFKTINPSYKKYFGNKTQRSAISRILTEYTPQQIDWVFNVLPKTNTMKYAPTIFTPIQFEDKITALISFLKKEKDTTPKFVKL